MKIIIAGGRDFTDQWAVEDAMWNLFAEDAPYEGGRDFVDVELEIVCGMASGADEEGRMWARTHKVPVKEFPADWDLHGKAAGFIRNKEMADYADALVAFWDGKSRGTKHMIETALRGGLEVHVYRY